MAVRPRVAEPCPWCGAKHKELMFRDIRPGFWVVTCPRCNASGPCPANTHQTYQQAITRWNGEEPPVCE
jgi:hypothetical protein